MQNDKAQDKKLTLNLVGDAVHSLPKYVDMVIVRATTGEFGILPGRMACVLTLAPGHLRVMCDGVEHTLDLRSGIASVCNDIVTIIAS